MKTRKTNQKVNVLDPRLKSRNRGFSGSEKNWEDEIKGPGLSMEQQEYINSLPRMEVKNSRNDELLHELYTRNRETARSSKLPNQQLMKDNEKQRRGDPLHCIRFLNKLRKGGVKCWYNATPYAGQIGLRAIRPGYERKGPQYICAVKLGWTTEYDIFHYDRYGVELNKKFIGWRSVLLQLVAKGVITEQKAHAIFGKPKISDATALYRQELWNIRGNRGQITT